MNRAECSRTIFIQINERKREAGTPACALLGKLFWDFTGFRDFLMQNRTKLSAYGCVCFSPDYGPFCLEDISTKIYHIATNFQIWYNNSTKLGQWFWYYTEWLNHQEMRLDRSFKSAQSVTKIQFLKRIVFRDYLTTFHRHSGLLNRFSLNVLRQFWLPYRTLVLGKGESINAIIA